MAQIQEGEGSLFARYRSLTVGDAGWGFLIRFELCMLLFRNTPGALGLFLRKVFFPGRNEAFTHHETLTAIGILSRLTMNGDRQPAILSGGGDLLLKDRPKWDGNSIDFYYWYFGSQALFQLDGPAGPRWKAWNESMSDALVQNQNAAASGCKAGSWEPVDRWSTEGGRVYATAINAMTLETYYIYPRVMR